MKVTRDEGDFDAFKGFRIVQGHPTNSFSNKSETVTTNSSFFNAFSLSNFNRSIELFRNFPLEKFFEEKDSIVTKYFA